MSNTIRRGIVYAAWILLCSASPGSAQSSGALRAGGIVAQHAAGETAQYEFDGVVHISAVHAPDVKLNIPDECSYRIRAVLAFHVNRTGAEGTLTGHVGFRGVRYDGPTCLIPPRTELAKALQRLEAEGTEFEINPAGDVHLRDASAAQCEGASVLLKAAWDLLQVRLSDQKLVPGPASYPSRSFLYWPDTFVEGMEVAATSLRYQRDVVLASQPYAWLEYKQVFAPADVPAYVETRSRARDFTGTTYVTGQAGVAVLFDRAGGRIVYLHRQRKVDNRMTLKYEPADETVPITTYAIDEDSTVRWIPARNSESWLAALHTFETEPVESGKAAAPGPAKAESKELSDLLDRTPAGFERWQKSYCSNVYCFGLSLAVPEHTTVAERSENSTLLLSQIAGKTVTVAVGPVLDQQYQGLNDEELLRQQSRRFVANYLWFAGRGGQALNFDISTVHDRPAGFSDFTAVGRNLQPIGGRLVIVIGPYNRLVPVTCSYAADEQAALDAICQTVTNSVVLH